MSKKLRIGVFGFILSIVLLLVIGIMPLTVSADVGWTAIGTCRYKIETKGTTVTLTIAPAEGQSTGTLPDDINSSSQWPWYGKLGDIAKTITNVVIEKGVKAGNSTAVMFSGCSNIESFDLSNFNTENVISMGSMFAACKKIKVLDLSNFNTEKVKNMNSMFYNCSELESINLSSFNTKNVEKIEGIFANCTKIKAETRIAYINKLLESNDGKCTTWTRKLFCGCSDETIDLTGLDTSKVTDISFMFQDCSNLTSINGLSNFDTKNVQYMSNTFNGCSKIKSIDLSSFDTKSLIGVSNMFISCSALETLDLSSFNTSNVTNMSSMFEKCSALKTIWVGSGWSTDKVTMSGFMFNECSSNLVGGKGTIWESDKPLDKTRACIDGGASKPGYLTAKPEFYAVFNKDAEGNKPANTLSFYYDGKYNDHKLVASKTVYFDLPTEATTEADWGYHDNRSDIIVVEIDASVANYHGLKSTAFMFSNMSSAGNISGCEYLDVSNVTNMSRMFWQFAKNNQKIEAVPNVSNWNTSNVTDMGSMFGYYGSTSTSITAVPNVSNWTTSNVTDMSAIFQAYAEKSNSITAVPDVSKWNTSNVTKMSYMFNKYAAGSKAKLQSLDLSKWNISKLSDASSMFQGYASANNLGDPIVFATNWSKTRTTGVTATDMFTDSKLNNAGTGDWALANNSTTGCFTEPEFYAVLNTAKEGDKPAYTLSFYYDGSKGKHKALSTVTVYDKLPTEATEAASWGYNSIRSSVVNVVIDTSVAYYHGLKNTAYMFLGMTNACNISGCEYLDVSKVTNMQKMFSSFGNDSNISDIPDVSNWDTSMVTDMSYIFYSYAYRSKNITTVPNVKNWNTHNVTNMDCMFTSYAFKSQSITDVPKVSMWDTSKVTNMGSMFFNYAASSTSITAVPDVSMWDTSKVANMYRMFAYYAYNSTSKLQPLDLSKWRIDSLTSAKEMFSNYNANSNDGLPTLVYATNWSVKKDVTAVDMFKGSKIKGKHTTSGEQWSLANNKSCFTSYFGTTQIADVKYTGKVINPTPTVYDNMNGGNTLTKDTDYTIEYANNTDAGLANITITGIGSHAGHKEVFYFNIAKRSVTFTSGDATKTYDGTPLTNKDVTTTGDGFVTGEGATFDVTGSQTDAGSSPNTFDYTLNEGTKADNYDITTVNGTIVVYRRSVTLTSGDATNIYDGTPLTNHNVTVTGKGFITGEGAQYTVTGSQTDAGNSDNKFGYTLNKGTNADNYNITKVYGTLTVTKRSVTITSASDSKAYDGTPLTNHNVTVSGEDFVQGEGAQYNVTGSQTEVGSSPNTFSYTLNEGTKAGNYDITTVYGTITVNKRKVILTSGSATKEFDRTPLTNDTVYSTGEDGWLGNDGASFNVTGSVTYVSTVKNEFTYTLNSGTKAGNYDIQLVFGDLTITNQKKQDVLMHLDETIASLLEIKDDYDDIIKNGVKILKDFEYEESESYAQNVRRIDKVANELWKKNSNARLEYCKDEASKLKNDVDQIIEEDNSTWLIKVTKFIGNATRKFFKFSLGNSLSIIQRNVQKFFNVIF